MPSLKLLLYPAVSNGTPSSDHGALSRSWGVVPLTHRAAFTVTHTFVTERCFSAREAYVEIGTGTDANQKVANF